MNPMQEITELKRRNPGIGTAGAMMRTIFLASSKATMVAVPTTTPLQHLRGFRAERV
jgi:hypothetical protein